ncbi:MAG: hypothetical protein ABI119_03365 [Gemmatimonadaceae bacterium]
MTFDPNEPRDAWGRWTNGGSSDPLDAATFGGSIANPAGSHLYIYHSTNVENLRDIAESGVLKAGLPGRSPSYDQNVWPDGSKQRRIYFMGDTSIVGSFMPVTGRPVVLRTKMTSDIRAEAYSNDFYSTKPIPASKLEYLANDGQWHPVRESTASAAKRPVTVRRATVRPLAPHARIGHSGVVKHE